MAPFTLKNSWRNLLCFSILKPDCVSKSLSFFSKPHKLAAPWLGLSLLGMCRVGLTVIDSWILFRLEQGFLSHFYGHGGKSTLRSLHWTHGTWLSGLNFPVDPSLPRWSAQSLCPDWPSGLRKSFQCPLSVWGNKAVPLPTWFQILPDGDSKLESPNNWFAFLLTLLPRETVDAGDSTI
jgi:hypothetical protein